MRINAIFSVDERDLPMIQRVPSRGRQCRFQDQLGDKPISAQTAPAKQCLHHEERKRDDAHREDEVARYSRPYERLHDRPVDHLGAASIGVIAREAVVGLV